MDFKSFLKDKYGYNMAFVVVNRLSKQAISLPCFKTTTVKDIARIYINNIYQIHGAPKLIISNRRPQFILDFWDEFCRILGIKIKLSTAFYP